jgi:cytochrome P450
MIRKRRASAALGRDVLSILLQTHDEEGDLSDEELVGQTAVLFGAAHMTTAHSLTWTLLLLAQHPTVMRPLWHELQSAGSRQKAAGSRPEAGSAIDVTEPVPGETPKGEELSLLDCVIKESMRLLPASAYSQRINNVPVQLGPLFLSRGTGIVFTPLVTHHLQEIYDQPERFQPDRWRTLRPSPYAYHPFGGGPRLCIGGPLATAIIRITLRKILTRYRLSVVPGANVDVHVESTMLVPTNGLPMRIDAADGQFESQPISGSIHELVEFDEAPLFGVDEFADQIDSSLSVVPRRPR